MHSVPVLGSPKHWVSPDFLAGQARASTPGQPLGHGQGLHFPSLYMHLPHTLSP
jgi:hypothetical protein